MAEIAQEVGDAHPRRFREYPKYMHSGVEWLGEIPAEWKPVALKRLSVIRYGLGEPPEESLDGLPFVRATDVYSGRIDERNIKRVNPRDVPWIREPTLRADDIVVVRSEAYTGDSAIVPRSLDGSVAGYDMFMRVHGVAPRFVAWAMQSRHVFASQIELVRLRAAQPHLNAEDLGAVVIARPPFDQQVAIAAFLDRETAKLDELVARKERLIELLHEKRSALITRAVTRGLDPNSPMKDSGVEWLGEIPAHWDVGRMKHVAKLESGHTPSRQRAEYWRDCTIPWFGLADVWQIRDGRREYVFETAEKVSEIGLAHSSARLLPKGTVMLSRTASVGFSAIMGGDMATTQDFANWVCGPRILPEYLLYVLRSMQHEFKRLTMGSTHQTIYMPDINRFCTPIPPHSEQEVIVDFIRTKTARIDALVSKVRQAIAHLQEFRTALISAAVTGKIDVREQAS